MYIFSLSRVKQPSGATSLTASPSLHFQLPLSMGFLRFSPIQNQCCSWSSDSLWATWSSSSTLSSYHITCHLVGCSHPPEGLVEELQDKVLLLRPADTQQVGSVPLTEQMSLKPSQLLLCLGGIKHLHTGDKDVSYSPNKKKKYNTSITSTVEAILNLAVLLVLLILLIFLLLWISSNPMH